MLRADSHPRIVHTAKMSLRLEIKIDEFSDRKLVCHQKTLLKEILRTYFRKEECDSYLESAMKNLLQISI